MNKSNNGFGLTFVDLLACGLGACILMFLIFSIKIGAKGEAAEYESQLNYNGLLVGESGLIDPSNQKGRMGIIRVVEFTDLNPTTRAALLTLAKSENLWDISSWNQAYMHSHQATYEIASKKNSVAFLFTYDLQLGPIKFALGNLSTADQRVNLNVHIIEGQSQRKGFSGHWTKRYERQLLNGLEIDFNIGKVSTDISRLISITNH